MLVVTWSYSNCPFALALPTERTEAVLQGLVEAFAFFGCVPRELWWDNPRTVAPASTRAGSAPRTRSTRRSRATTRSRPGSACPRPRPRSRASRSGVQDLERQWATPVPRVGALGELNAHLLRQCLAARERTCGDNTSSVATRFEHDRAAALAAPARAFDPCVIQPGQADKYQTVPFDRNRYSVPRGGRSAR
ncbi:hypothetical protein J8F10_05715 [Gemmata sp. G18]|uniref:Transposase n=1 Tax=Gemmata palustris TaxID=2822762 RepID=A0ABS5BM36_9BACT|nr:hypothetical protein [Gemmata palustris]MBP3954779.1 hypothetical protein [Gemmata palustris]